MRPKCFLKQFGQTSIEYILILAVSAGLGAAFFKSARRLLLDNPNSFISKSLNDYSALLGGDYRYKTFRLRR